MFCVIAVIILILTAFALMFRHELKTLSTLKERSKGVYTMEYDGDYGFDEFLKSGAKSDKDIDNDENKVTLNA